jgi:TolB-like protein
VIALRAAPPSLFVDREYDGGVGRIAHLAYSADGRLLAAGGARGFGVWDAQTGNLIRRDAVPASVVRVGLNAQGTLLALGADDGRVTVIDLRSGTPREVTRHSRSVTALAFTADGRTAASGDGDGNIILWDPDRGTPTPLKDGGHKDDILALGFSGANSLLSASRDLRVVTWDVSGKRALRRATIQSEVTGRTVVPTSAATDGDATRLVVGGQLISQPRGGVLAGRGGLARPEDLRRDNVLMPYVVATGISPDPIRTGDFQPEQVALAPGGCFAFFTSFYRDQPRLHVWGLVEQGDDLLRTDLTARAAALALDPGARSAAVAFESGRIQTFRVSGATTNDCDTYTKQAAPPTKGPTITLGTETSPLIKGGTGARIAVLRFEATGLDPGLGDAVAEMVAGELANNPQITVVERAAINAIVKEMALQSSGLTAADAVKVGKGLNARKVLFGSVRRFGESTYLTTARVVDVETQQIEGSREVTCENCREQDLPRAVAALRRAIVP